MPPRKKRPPPDPPQPQAQPEHSASPSQNDENSDDHEDSRTSAATDDEPIPQLFNTAFSTYRVSPLHISSQEPLTASRLQTLSRRLRDLVVGDVVRGVQVGLSGGGLESDATLGRAGALEHVEWRWVPLERLLGGKAPINSNNRERSLELGSADADAGDGGGRQRGRGGKGRNAKARAGATSKTTERRGKQSALCLELSYENSTFTALLLPDISPPSGKKETDISRLPWISSMPAAKEQDSHKSTFLHLPLLILKLPAPLKSILVDFLSSTFDCRVSPLRLGTRTLVRCWEDWLAHHTRNSARRQRQQQHKDVTLTLGFHLEPVFSARAHDRPQEMGKPDGNPTKETLPQLGLKSLDVVIPAAEIVRFLRAGEDIASQTVAERDGRETTATAPNKRKANDDDDDTESHRRLRRKLAGGREDEGWEWRRRNPSSNNTSNPDSSSNNDGGREQQSQPFTEALASYLKSHLALDLFHPGVRVQRVVCAGFVMAETGRVRIARPRPVAVGLAPDGGDDVDGVGADVYGGVWNLVQELVGKARGGEWSADAVKLARLVANSEEEGRKGGVG